MSENGIELHDLQLETGYLCLDFANTADWHASEQPDELLNSYDDLLAWAKNVGLLAAERVRQLSQAVDQSGEAEPAAALAQALALREAIYRIFSATAAGRSPAAADLTLLNHILSETLTQLRVAPTEAGFAWRWADESQGLDQILGPIARSAAELLTSESLDRVKECEDDRGCGFLFYDTSRNRSRRWCTMRSCGNRAKVQRHRRRQAGDHLIDRRLDLLVGQHAAIAQERGKSPA